MVIKNQEALNERANNLGDFNGIRLVLVSLSPTINPKEAIFSVHFYNNNQLDNIFNEIIEKKVVIFALFLLITSRLYKLALVLMQYYQNINPNIASEVFPIIGGSIPGQVKVTGVYKDDEDNKILNLIVEPIGNYSTYILNVVYNNIDPIFSEIEFKFRPGCFNNCAPDWDAPQKPKENPLIDYLAKDYDSFRHTLFSWMTNRVPGWQPTSEADLDQVLLSLFAVAADELSDYQDRVMNEAYLATARKRVSIARHSRLLDYYIDQGNQANTWLVVQVSNAHTLEKGFLVWTGEESLDATSVVFITHQEQEVHPLLNEMGLYTWSGTIPALAAGSTSADLKLSTSGEIPATTVRDLIVDGKITHLLIQEHFNPLTGETLGRDPTRRQLLKLISEETEALQDPVKENEEWFVRVSWEEKDKLKRNYCFTVNCPTDDPTNPTQNVSLFHGNLVQVYHGRPVSVSFQEFDESLPLLPEPPLFYTRTKKQEAICQLPAIPLAYLDTPPGGEVPPESTLEVEVEVDGSRDPWDEVIDLIHSDDSDERGDRFVVETDELGRSWIRFGNGTNGKQLPDGAIVNCTYQIGQGLDGNVGADSLQHFDENNFPNILACWNPFDVTNGREPEPVAEILRRVPQAYRYRQLRAITLKDYENRAAELPEVSQAVAKYYWTGSSRTVRVAIDPVGTSILEPEVREKVARHLEAVRLIGEDLEIRPPRFVPLDIKVSLCIHPNYWVEDIRFILEQEFSDGYTPDGRMAFFHPDRWTFGQELRVSQIIGAVQGIQGVEHVIEVKLKRWNEVTPGKKDVIEVRANEIVLVKNNRDRLEDGLIKFDIKGGRQ